jgi:hypothetical protein
VANLIKKIALDRIRYVVEQLHIQGHLVIVNAPARPTVDFDRFKKKRRGIVFGPF